MPLFDVYPKFDLQLTAAKGVYVYDANQQAYLDLYGGHGVISIGHQHPTYVARLTAQLNAIGFYSNAVAIPLQEVLAQQLGQMSSYEDYQLFLCNSGAEANENALKIASFHTGKKRVVAFRNAFHGRTAAALNVTDSASLAAPLNQQNFPVTFLDLNAPEQLQAAFRTDDVCAVILEGIQGVGGLDFPTAEYLTLLVETCQKHGALLIADEIQSGYGRSGRFFAHQRANIQADIITLAKGMGNGFPIGGVLISPTISPRFGMLGSTFGGNHLACTAAIAVLDVIETEALLQNALEVGQQLKVTLESLPQIQQVKGEGLMLGIELPFAIKTLRRELLQKHHIFTGASANPNLLRILPPLNITFEQLQPFVEALKKIHA
ncbi:MAG: aspartate aminotransferase family protein [Thermonemataceae bacterium]